jgi:hypothetical protein
VVFFNINKTGTANEFGSKFHHTLDRFRRNRLAGKNRIGHLHGWRELAIAFKQVSPQIVSIHDPAVSGTLTGPALFFRYTAVKSVQISITIANCQDPEKIEYTAQHLVLYRELRNQCRYHQDCTRFSPRSAKKWCAPRMCDDPQGPGGKTIITSVG